MNISIISNDSNQFIDDGGSDHLLNSTLPDISLPNQDGVHLKINRNDLFRIVLYCYPRTGHPNKPLPENWNNIPGATGCTAQTCSFRDCYEEFIKLNAIPIGLSTQTVDEIKEMTQRLNIPYDVLSDSYLELTKKINLPTFSINDNIFTKRLTLIFERSLIKKVFYPIFSPHLHADEVLKWLSKYQ